MAGMKAYTGNLRAGRISVCSFPAVLLVAIMLLAGGKNSLQAQPLPEYDEIAVSIEIPGLGAFEMDALIKDQNLYLPVVSLFNFLKIKCEPSPDMDIIKGFFSSPESSYLIDRPGRQITYLDKRFDLGQDDIIRTETNVYLLSDWFGKVFGLDCNFSFRSMSVVLTPGTDLPLIREMKQEEMRKNISRLKGEFKADTVIGRDYPAFKFGMADWGAYTSQEINGKSDARLNLDLGAMIAGGEATASLYYNSSAPFSEKQQRYLWRYVNNDFAPLRQIIAGKIHAGALSSLYNPVIGVQLTNTPTTYRRSFGTYLLSDHTEPGWMVELYVNNVLVDFVKADASGFFSFQVPLVYGNTVVRLKFFGPWGEERTREQNINIPYNFLPEKTLEYTASAGIVEDSLASRFSRANISYGLSRNITIGGGAEYLSSITSQPFMPFVNASLKITNNMLVYGEYAHGVRTKGTFSYRLPSNMQLEINYTWYDKEQKAIFYNYREERRATLTVPLRLGKFSTFNRFSVNQIVLPSSKYTTGEWLITGSVFGINTNLTTYALFVDEIKPYIYSNLALAFNAPLGFMVMPQVQYSFSNNEVFSVKTRIEKKVFKNGFLNMSFERNFRNDITLAEAGLRYDFSFAQAGASVRQYGNRTSLIQYARGSIINDRKTSYLKADNRTNVGRGGITVVPFLDLNSNGRKDAGEPRAKGLNLRTNGGRIEISERDTTIRIIGLEPYTYCFIEVDPNNFESISWRLPKSSYNIAVDPNVLKTVEIPISITGEGTGYVTLGEGQSKRGLGGIIVRFLDEKSVAVAQTLSEDDGYFSYFGFTPGNYIATIDTAQLRRLGMVSEPKLIDFTIKGGTEGDIAEKLDFLLTRIPADTVAEIPEETRQPEIPVVVTDTSYMILHELTEEVYTITEDSWAIQIGAFKSKSYAEGFESMLERELGKDVQITIAGEYYRVRILDLPTRAEVDENVAKLNKLGFKELWIIRLLAMQQERILVTRTDSIASIRETISERERPLTPAEKAEMQLDAFRLGSDAAALRKYLSAPLDEQNKPDYTGKYYRLETPQQPILDPTVLEAIKDLDPEYGRLGMEDDWVVRAVTPVTEEPAEPERKEPVIVTKVPVMPESSVSVVEERPAGFKLEDRPAFTEPSVALQVAIYHKESQALKAQKRIMSKLNLPVDIVKQFDYYHVIVTGFYSREETFPYYPELAEIGYPGVTLIENYKRVRQQ
jgi:hypothetical protein